MKSVVIIPSTDFLNGFHGFDGIDDEIIREIRGTNPLTGFANSRAGLKGAKRISTD